ncbi:MAG: hypothetical protein JNJ41_13485 [Bacteroidia bacterium]|nr:hypothetical protein [Bacteroidia bacterium]
MNDKILKTEKVGYLKSKINLQQATLTMTATKISLQCNKTAMGGLGLLGALLRKRIEKIDTVFDLDLESIRSVEQGKFGAEKNVMQITFNQNVTYRVIVNNYKEWEDLILHYFNKLLNHKIR